MKKKKKNFDTASIIVLLDIWGLVLILGSCHRNLGLCWDLKLTHDFCICRLCSRVLATRLSLPGLYILRESGSKSGGAASPGGADLQLLRHQYSWSPASRPASALVLQSQTQCGAFIYFFPLSAAAQRWHFSDGPYLSNTYRMCWPVLLCGGVSADNSTCLFVLCCGVKKKPYGCYWFKAVWVTEEMRTKSHLSFRNRYSAVG